MLAALTLVTLPILAGPDDWLAAPEAYKAQARLEARTLTLENGLIRRAFRLDEAAHSAGCFSFEDLRDGRQLVRAVRPEALLTIDGKESAVGGLSGQPVGNFLLPGQLDAMAPTPGAWRFEGWTSGPIEARFDYKPRKEWLSREVQWPPRGVHIALKFSPPDGAAFAAALTVHYELYDGLPVLCKWFSIANAGPGPFKVDGFASETLALVEAESSVDVNPAAPHPDLHIETDFTTVAMMGEVAQRETVRWLPDPSYTTQVGYDLKTPCLLECRPPKEGGGPARTLGPGEGLESFRTWELVPEAGREPARRTLALNRMYRTIAPWTQENPLIFHCRSADPPAVRGAIDQAADVGFELVLMTFGSGFNIENTTPAYRASMKALADYAHSKGVALGGYSLLASRSVGPEDDVINPATGKPGGFARFGSSPCLGSPWGDRYFAALTGFFEETGCDVLEHDGSYPGDACASTKHPGHAGYEDSRWRQWERITRFYRWCRGRGVYLNVPDWYFLNGSNKTGMGYRETNWSLPREQQEIIERQNIADGTRFKTPSMGWMFVPLSEYHGGGAAATIEPLKDHLDHYERRLQNLLSAGVQACWRGPRLYDAPETREMASRWVAWFKSNRRLLESDLILLRRADGRDWDGWMHVDPGMQPCAMAVLFNPLETPIERDVRLPVRLAGVRGAATVRTEGGEPAEMTPDERGDLTVRARLPARGMVRIEISRKAAENHSPP